MIGTDSEQNKLVALLPKILTPIHPTIHHFMKTQFLVALSFIFLICFAPIGFAQEKLWDEPKSTATFQGKLIGHVKWVPKHTNDWFVFVVDDVTPSSGDPKNFEDIIGKSVKVEVGTWITPSQADPNLVAFVSKLKPDEALTIQVRGEKDPTEQTFRFTQVP